MGTKTEKTTTPKTDNYLLCVGAAHYSIDEFVSEAAAQGVSRRCPSQYLPGGLALLNSKIWLTHGSGRKNDPGVIFGYFQPDAIEFIAGPDGETKYADLIAGLKEKWGEAVHIIKSTATELVRKCGYRKVGGTYMVSSTPVKGTESPVVVTPEQEYDGHSFRGLMKLTAEQGAALEAGKGLTTLVKEECMECGAEVKVGPSSKAEADKERRRMEKGEHAKWVMRCPECAAKVRKARADAKKAAKELGEEATKADQAKVYADTLAAGLVTAGIVHTDSVK